MRWRTIALASWGLAFLLSLPAAAALRHRDASHNNATHSIAAHGGNCVAYAKAVTGIRIDGNAGLWWSHAAGRYDRGQQPKIGSILVFKSSGHMRSGHVAVVSEVIGPRKILVDHANWEHGRVTKAMAVIDTSLANDWTSVKVLGNRPEDSGQRDNPTFGFIYPRNLSENIVEVKTDARDWRHDTSQILRVHLRSPHAHTQVADATPITDKPAIDGKPAQKHRRLVEPH